MLVRCRYCGAVFPDETTKCRKCGKVHTPMPSHVIKTVITYVPTPKTIKRVQMVDKILGLSGSFLIMISILLCIIGAIMDNHTGIILMSIGAAGLVVGAIFLFIVYNYDKRAEKKTETVEENKPPEINAEEYEKMLYDFISDK